MTIPQAVSLNLVPILSRCPIACCLTATLFVGCGGGGGSSSSTGSSNSNGPTVAETLEGLGIDTAETPRVDHSGEDLPTDYSPLGPTAPITPQAELLVVGFPANSGLDALALYDPLITAPPSSVELMHSLDTAEAAWAVESVPINSMPATLRAVVPANVDEDAIEESVVAYVAEGQIHILVIQDEEQFFVRSHHFGPAVPLETYDVALAAGDMDGDGLDELVVAFSALEGSAEYFLMDQVGGDFLVVPGSHQTVYADMDNRILLELETGHLDYDAAKELVLVANEYTNTGVGEPLRSTYTIIDDPLGSSTVLATERIFVIDQTEQVFAQTADIALGDVDADGLDEVLIAGMIGVNSCSSFYMTLLALDDAAHDLEDLGSLLYNSSISGCNNRTIEWAHVGTVDLEDDGAREVYVNGLVFTDFNTGAWQVRDEIPSWGPVGINNHFTARSSAVVAADFTGDGREDLAFYGVGQSQIRIFGVQQADPDFLKLRHIPIPNYSSTTYWPRNIIMVPVNADLDTTVMEFVEHEYLMTQPVVLAVLAAAPGAVGIGQNTDACVTTYGDSESGSSGTAYNVNFGVGFIVGGAFKEWGNGVDIQTKIELEYGYVWQETYTVETSVSFQTGPLEDTVIFTTVPYDHYTYRVISDPDPLAVDQLITISVPRTPIMLQTDRDFYNASVGEVDVVVDETIFQHAAGDISSYMTRAEKEDTLDDWPGISVPVAISCGQGLGSTGLEIAVATEQGHEEFLGIGFEFEASTIVAGIKLGVSMSAQGGTTWTRTIGESTTFGGSVGAIDAAHFPTHGYQFGLFTYRQTDPGTGQQFHVINYWVE